MKLLVLGGTIFLGRHLVETALERGHRITLFNRGQHNPDLFPDVEKLRGDRDGDLASLRGRHWDAVVDTCGYVPRVVRASAGLLADAVDHYTFISSISVYADFSVSGIDESAPVGKLSDESVEEIDAETYGPLKALCEQAAEQAMPGRVLNIRPGLIVGPHDPSGRFTYWPRRVAQGGHVLAPDEPDKPVQIVDVRDLSRWIIEMIESGRTGVYNATGPDDGLTMGEVLKTCKAVAGSEATFTWVSEEFLLEQEVQPFIELPLWSPKAHIGSDTVDCDKAITAGLTFRPLADTVRDTLAWDAARPPDVERRAGLTDERETELLAAWDRLATPK